MTRTLYARNSLFMRVVSTVVALSFTLSFAGTGFAAPSVSASDPSDPALVAEAPAPDVGAPEAPAEEPAAQKPKAEEPVAEEPVEAAPDPSVEAAPTTTEPNSGDVQGEQQSESVSPETPSEPAAQAADTGMEKSPLKSAPQPLAALGALSEAAALSYADSTSFGWEAYRVSPEAQIGWGKENLGLYREGDWIPVRIFVDNRSGATDLLFPSFQVAFDYLNDGKNAIAVDDAKGFFYFATSSGALPGATPYPGGSTGIGGLFSESVSAGGDYFNISMTTPSPDLVVPAGEYGIVYFQVHLALTPYWQEQTPAHFGAKEYPGSSAQGRFISWNGGSVGDNTIPIPVGKDLEPEGEIKGIKFNDLDHDSVKDAGEPGLSGWVFTLHYSGEFPSTETTTSGAGGAFSFTGLPAGPYTLTETLVDPWTNSTPLSRSITLARDEVRSGIEFGNYIPDLTKTWSLSIGSLPSGGTPYVRYSIDGAPSVTTTLTGSGPYTASVDVPPGTEISDIAWYVGYGGQQVLLGVSPDETLTEDKTNTFTYDSSVSGMKFNAETEAGIAGWTIVLKRVMGSVETTYATAITGAGGAYSFEDVIPGTYAVYEVQQSGWMNTVAPVGTFAVANGSHIAGKDFGNLFMVSTLNIVKSGTFGAGADALADVGELITYQFTVTNTGNITLHGVTVTDSKVPVITYVSGDTDLDNALDLTETWLYTGTYAVTQADINLGSVLNLATADSIESPPDTDDETVVLPQDAGIQLEKQGAWVDGNGDGNADVGETVLYTFSVTNTGNVTLYNVMITDPLVIVVGGPIAILPVGVTNSTTFMGSYALTQSDIDAGSVYNLALVTGTPPVGPNETDTDDNLAPLPQDAMLNIVKSGTFGAGVDGLADVGELITYQFTVNNTGNITLHGVTVTDPKVPVITYVSGDTDLDSALDLTETWIYTGTYAVTQADINLGSVLNLATADSVESPPDTDDETVVLPLQPAIGVVKTVSSPSIVLGESVTYTYVVTNTGNVDLFNVTLTDDKLGAVVPAIPTLVVGGSATFTLTAQPTVDTTNVVTAVGTDSRRNQVSAIDDAFVEVALPFTPPAPPDMAIEKTADKVNAGAGESVVYTLTYENVGEDDAFDIVITDDYDERYVTVTDAGGGTVSGGKITWTIAGPLSPADGPQEISYRVRIDSALPESVSRIDNVVLVTTPDDANPDNNRDTWSVGLPEEPFLPFTGGEWTLLAVAALLAVALGVFLRRLGRQVS